MSVVAVLSLLLGCNASVFDDIMSAPREGQVRRAFQIAPGRPEYEALRIRAIRGFLTLTSTMGCCPRAAASAAIAGMQKYLLPAVR